MHINSHSSTKSQNFLAYIGAFFANHIVALLSHLLFKSITTYPPEPFEKKEYYLQWDVCATESAVLRRVRSRRR